MTPPRTHDEVAELLGAYALDAVDDTDGEREAVRLHLLECARCRAEVREHREVAALLAQAGEPAPAAVWDRIAASVEGQAPPAEPPVLAAVPAPPPAARRWWTRVAAGLAAAAVVAIAALGWLVLDQGRRLDDVEGRAGAEAGLAAALADPGSTVVQLEGDDGLRVRAVVSEDGQGYLTGAALPLAADGRAYQLWGARGDQLVSLGVLGRDPETVVAFSADGMSALALTVEEDPGPVPHGPRVAFGELRV